MKFDMKLNACLVLAFVVAGALSAELPANDSGDKLTPEQVAVILAQIADNQVKPSRSGQQTQQQDNESYQRVYESFSRLLRNMSNNSLSNMRRVVSRLNQLVGGTPTDNRVVSAGSDDERAQQLLDRLDQVRPQTDAHSLRNLNEDISKFVSTLSDSYLRNIRRVLERMNRVVGRPTPTTRDFSTAADEQRPMAAPGDAMDGDGFSSRPVGFPGWDELVVAVDRVQKSLAQFVRSSTRLITSG